MENSPTPVNAYAEKQQKAAMDARKQSIHSSIKEIESLVKGQPTDLSMLKFMDLLESVVKSCGGDSKLQFADITHKMVRANIRVPMIANIFPFAAEGDDNPRFHKIVSKILLLAPCVTGVRWISPEGERNGTIIIVEIKGDNV